jgi:hypothetical protein
MADEIKTPALHFISYGSNTVTDLLPAAAMTSAVTDALLTLDRDRPRTANVLVAGAGLSYVDLSSGAAGWVEGVSDVLEVHNPYVLGEEHEVDFEDWEVLADPTMGDTLLLREGRTIAAGTSARLVFTIQYTEATVPAILKYKVAKLAAANMARMIGARMAQSADNTIAVDTFGRNISAGDWARIAKDLTQEYRDAMGLGKDIPVKAASADLQMLPAAGPYGRLHNYPENER